MKNFGVIELTFLYWKLSLSVDMSRFIWNFFPMPYSVILSYNIPFIDRAVQTRRCPSAIYLKQTNLTWNKLKPALLTAFGRYSL